MYLNKALVIGNLTRDPEMKSLPSGIQVTTFSVATNRVWKDKNGVKQESADYHNIVVFGRQAETVAQYLRKGSSVLVEGRMQTRSWDGPDGKKNYRTEIVADRVQFGPRPSGAPSGFSTAPVKSDNKEAVVPPMETIDYPEESINLDDIPF
ncbi:MAG: single-stranded DNA-binding protein [Patescibacteria group bacterium]